MEKQQSKDKEESIWSDGFFSQSVDPNDKDKMMTFHMKHDEEMDFSCSKCKTKISAHNKDWHNGMCDKCFNKKYFPDAEEDLMTKEE